MTKLKILVTVPKCGEASRALANDPNLDVAFHDEPAGGHGVDALDWPAEWFRNTEITFTSGVMPATTRGMETVKWSQFASAGYESAIDLKLGEHGIRVTNANGVFDVPIAEWNIGMIFALARNLRGLIRNQEHTIWDRNKQFQIELRGSTVGFWGYGGLSRETARLAKGMGLKVHVLVRDGIKKRHHYLVPGTGDPEGKLPDRVFNMDQKKEFLGGLDFLIIAMPQTPASIGAIGEAELKMLSRHAYLLNPARGPLIQEQALIRALREGWIAGAALDTHYHYPMPPEHPLWKFPNVIMTPHISGSSQTQHYLSRTWEIFTENLKRYRAGQPLLNELTLAQLRGE